MQAVLAQDRGDGPRVVAAVSRKLTITEAKLHPVVQRVGLTAWALRTLSRYTAHLKKVTIAVPDGVICSVVVAR